MKRKNQFYVPGLISAVGLPILLLFFSPKAKLPQTCIKMFLPSDHISYPGLINFSRDYICEEIRRKRVVKIEFTEFGTGNAGIAVFQEKLQVILRQMDSLASNTDTNRVLQVSFGPQSTYGHFILVLNQALIFQLRRFVFIDNSLYFFPNPRAAPTSSSKSELFIK